MKPGQILLWTTLAGLVVCGGLLYREGQNRRQLHHQLASTTQARDSLQVELTQARTRVQAQEAQLHDLDADLGATKTRLTATEARSVQLSRKAAALEVQLQDRARQLAEVNARLAAANQELATARANPASEESVAHYQATITDLRRQVAELRAAVQPVPSALPPPTLTTSRARTASVVSVGPANAFVVLNYGARHGALPRQTFQVRRGTETLATVHISDVRENYSIAQVQPDSLRGALHKGDSAVLNSPTP